MTHDPRARAREALRVALHRDPSCPGHADLPLNRCHEADVEYDLADAQLITLTGARLRVVDADRYEALERLNDRLSGDALRSVPTHCLEALREALADVATLSATPEEPT